MRQIDNELKRLDNTKKKLPGHLKEPLSKDINNYISAVQAWSDAINVKLTALIIAEQQRDLEKQGLK